VFVHSNLFHRSLTNTLAWYENLRITDEKSFITLAPGVAIQHNLDLKTRLKQLLGSLPLVIVLPGKV
jgi:hypothetical protein